MSGFLGAPPVTSRIVVWPGESLPRLYCKEVKMVTATRRLILILFLAFLAPPANAQNPMRNLIAPEERVPARSVRAVLDRMLYDYDVVELPLAALDHQVKSQGRLALLLRNQLYQLELAPNDLRAEDYRAVLIVNGTAVEQSPGPVVTFAGHVAGEPESIVRLTATPELFIGYIKTPGEWLFIDSLREYVPGAPNRLAVVYRETDVRPEASGLCGLEHLNKAGPTLGLDSSDTKVSLESRPRVRP